MKDIFETHEKLFDKLVPVMGECDTVGGELIRASARLMYDGYTNGFFNNNTGAFIYIEKFFKWNNEEFVKAMEVVKPQVFRSGYGSWTPEIEAALETIVVKIADYVDNDPDLQQLPNPNDLFDFEIPEQHYYNDEY